MTGQVFYKRKTDGAIIPINSGPKGDKGDTGPQGAKGDTGEPGEDFTPTDADDRYVNTDGDTMTGDLSVVKPAAGNTRPVKAHADSGSVGLELGVTANGDFGVSPAIWPKVADATPQTDALTFDSIGKQWQVGQTTATAKPLALVTAIDPTTGRLAIGGMEIGDTGWRGITAELINGWTANNVSIRRIGSTVWLRLYLLDPATQTGTTILTLPSGFQTGGSRANGHVGALFNGGTGANDVLQSSVVVAGSTGDSIRVGSSIGSTCSAVVSFPVETAWPTTLPGTPA